MRFNSFLLLTFVGFVLFTSTPATAQDTGNSIEYARGLSRAFEAVAGRITPSIVSISSVKKVKTTRDSRRQAPPDPFFEHFRDFFGEDFLDRFSPPGGPDGFSQQGLGTGVIIDDKGHILTNNHVLGDADDVTVRLSDKRSFKAEIVGKDPRTDLAVIKINAKNITPAKLGDSDKMNIGQLVVAAGNPFGLENSITAGIVSAKGRSIMGGSQYEDFIQTDAAINPGNSGGPLLNLEGEVIGINTAIFSRSGGYMGIGFAIPINMARSIMESLISKGKVIRGWLGVGIQNLTEDLARSFNYSGTAGALVGHIEKNGPAAKSDLKQGDIIVQIDDAAIEDINQLRNLIASIKPGAKVMVHYIRDGRKRITEVKIGELPTSVPGEQTIEIESEADSDLGISVENLTSDIAKRLNTDRKEGVVVNAVQPNSIAAQAGVQVRDIILIVDSQNISDVKSFKRAIEKSDLNKGIRLVIENQGMQRFVFLKSSE